MSEQYNSAFAGNQIDEAVNKVLNEAPIFGGVVQALTEAQQKQARENIGAASSEEVKQLSEEIADLIVTEGAPDTLTWDGDTTGLVDVAGVLFKVSDAVPTKEDFANGGSFGRTHITMGSETVELSAADIQGLFAEDGLLFDDLFFAIVPYDNYEIDGSVIPEKGVYFILSEGYYCNSLTINGYAGFGTDVINPKNLPKSALARRKYLYTKKTDDVWYLYHRPVDFTYGINPTTKAQLQEIFENYDALYLSTKGTTTEGETFEVYSAVGNVEFFATYGAIYVDGVGLLYTAEYTAPTTETTE